MSETSPQITLAELPGVEVIGYGINRPGPPDHEGIPMVRAGDIVSGRIIPANIVSVKREVAEDHHTRTLLRPGDLLIVLVGRIGDAAVVGPEHTGWNIARSVALIRCAEPGLAQWLRVWFSMPTARSWCEANAVGTVQRTLGLKALRQLPVALPPVADRDDILRVVHAIESRSEINYRIAHTAVALADAHFDVLAADKKSWPDRTFKHVLREVQTGTAQRSTGQQEKATFVAPADIFRGHLPYLEAPDATDPPDAHGTILVAPKSEHVHAVFTRTPVIAGRGVLVLVTQKNDEIWWLLHDIRSRSTELSQLAQGTAARELSAGSFSQAKVAWPPEDVLGRFARIARVLHARAKAARLENRTLETLLEDYLSSVSLRWTRHRSRRHGRVELGR